MARIRIIVVHWLPTIAWAGLIFYLSSQPEIKLPGKEFVLKDKAAHAVVYGVLCALVLFGARTAKNPDLVRGLGLTGVISYGLLDEIHQRFVPGRFCEANDFLADAVGATSVYLLFLLTRRSPEGQADTRKARAG